MKKTKGTITIFIILAILVLGIGYAAMSANLKIEGTASAGVDNSNFKVVYTNAVAGKPTYASKTEPIVTATVNKDDATKADITVSGFTSVNDEVTVTYTIANQSEDLAATIGTPTVTNNNETYFQVTSEVTGETSLAAKTGTTTQTITVKCIKTPTAETQTANITVTLNANLAQ